MRKNIRAEIAKLLGIYLRSYKSFENDKEKEGDGYCSSAGDDMRMSAEAAQIQCF